MSVKPGICLGDRYILQRQIGKGGTGTVYLAMDRKIQRERAVKAVEKAVLKDLALWKKELYMMKRLHHSHLVEIFDVLEDDRYVFFVMEYVDGYSVRQLLDTGNHFSTAQTIDYGIQVCQVLAYLHGQEPSVIYRDLKPSNLMLRQDKSLVMIDLGSAREFCRDKTEDTVFWGTVGYAAPEQVEGCGQTDARTDIYSLGVTLYEMASGERFSRKKVERPVTALEEIVEMCTRRNPGMRYQNVSDLERDLRNYEYLGKRRRKKKKRIQRLLALTFSVTLLCFDYAFLLLGQSERLLQEGYQRYLETGRRGSGSKVRNEGYKQCIQLNPWKPEAYLGLLSEMRSQGFSQKTYGELLEILNSRNSVDGTCEECLMQSLCEYGHFAYELGIACYFEWEGYGNKRYALPWLQTVKQTQELPEQIREQADCLGKIAGYYDLLAKGNPAGEVSFDKYWEDLKILGANQGDKAVKKLIQQELAGQILKHARDFYDCGISRQELQMMLDLLGENRDLEPLIQETETLLDIIYESA